MSVTAALVLALIAQPAEDPTATPAATGQLSSGELADLCQGRVGTSTLLCAAFLRGAFEGLMSAEMALTDGDPSFCLPDAGVTLGDVRSTFLAFMREEADQRDERAGLSLLASLEERYPCPDAEDDLGAPDIA